MDPGFEAELRMIEQNVHHDAHFFDFTTAQRDTLPPFVDPQAGNLVITGGLHVPRIRGDGKVPVLYSPNTISEV